MNKDAATGGTDARTSGDRPNGDGQEVHCACTSVLKVHMPCAHFSAVHDASWDARTWGKGL